MTAPSTGQVTALYRARMANLSAGLQLRLQALWSQQFNPDLPGETLTAIGAAAGVWITSGQAVAVRETNQWLRALIAVAAGLAVARVAPFTGGSDVVGSAAADNHTVSSLTAMAPAVYFARIGVGRGPEEAATVAQGWLNRVAGTEPSRAANQTTLAASTDDDRFTGRVNRITAPGACEFCAQIADRGYIPANAGFEAHPHCRCTPAPEISSHVYSRAGIRRAQRAG